jgi:nucleotide-binding universal stress UspA family protein
VQRPVVVGVDGSPASRAALRWAAVEARRRDAPLRVVHAWEPLPPIYMKRLRLKEAAVEDAARAELAECVRSGLRGYKDSNVETGLVRGSAACGLVDAGSDAQLLVVGARGRGGFEDLLIGSTSSQCVIHAPCPVAVVREPATPELES